MRWFCAVLAVVAGCAMLAAMAVGLVQGDYPGWLLVGPLPLYLVGAVAFWRRPDHLSVRWLLVSGSFFALEGSLGAFLIWGAGTVPDAALVVIALLRQWASLGSSFSALVLITTFPSGRPEGRLERAVLGVAAVLAALLPLVNALSAPTLAPGQFADVSEPSVASPVAVPALAWLGPASATMYQLYPLWVVLGVGLLALRYRRSAADRRRRIRWMLVGWTASVVTWVPLLLFTAPAHPTVVQVAVASLMWPLTQVLILGSMLIALFQDGVFGIDEPARRRYARTILRLLIGLAGAMFALGFGMLAGQIAGTPAAVLTAVVLMAAARPVWQRLESAADRLVFGSRLDGYDMLARFGTSLEVSPTPARLAEELAGTLHAGLDVTWATVTLDAPIVAAATAGATGSNPPAANVGVAHAGETFGQMACGPRRDGPLLDEDRRLLVILAAQAGAAASALRLSAELAERVRLIRSQAAELAASRDRVLKGQDVERRRIQRDLHDGIQQEIVALSAKVSLARQRLVRGDPTTADALAELQRDLGILLAEVRDFAHTIHPPVLADRGLVEAVEGQAARLAVPTRVRADPDLRTIRLPERVESAAWYALAEAMSNVVKHAAASNSEVTLHRDDGHLVLSVQDDGRGFDPAGPRGLGLTGLADRLDTVGGSIRVESRPGAGTLLSMQIPIAAEVRDG